MFLIVLAGLLGFGLTVLATPHFIRFYQLKKIGGQQMHEDVKQHLEKAGTPTMGGAVFLAVALLVSFVFGLVLKLQGQSVANLMAILVILLLYGAIGFLDDFLKIFKQRNEGLTSKQKMGLQILSGLIFYITQIGVIGNHVNVFGWQLPLGFLYLPFLLFWLVGFSNAVNLTDGIDGLASISVVISLSAYAVIAFKQGQWDVLLLMMTMIGALIGFFVFNRKPAKVFMGDVGSLALGAMLAAISLLLHQEWTLLLIGLVYVLETSSVMMQVSYFKWTKRRFGEGRRIFRMTPLHHHLELGGLTGKGKSWSEWRVDFFFWSLGLLASLLVLVMLYL